MNASLPILLENNPGDTNFTHFTHLYPKRTTAATTTDWSRGAKGVPMSLLHAKIRYAPGLFCL